MSKGEDSKFLKIQSCVLKVNICCDGCQKKVRKVLNKIDGVYTTTVDAEERKVTVTGNVDPAVLIKRLGKAGKHAELWATKGGNQQHFANMLQKLQLEHAKGQPKENGKALKGGGGGGGGGGKEQIKCQQPAQQKQPPPQQHQGQAKGFKDLTMLPNLKDLKLPFKKDDKKVKFNLPAKEEIDDGSEYTDDDDDEFDDDDEMFDEMDEFDDDIFDDPKMMKRVNFQPNNGHGLAKDKKGGGGKGGIVQLLNKAMGGSNGGGGKNGGGGNQNQANGGSGGGGKKGHAPHDGKNGGGNNNSSGKGGHGQGNQAHHGNHPAHGGGHKTGGNGIAIGGGGGGGGGFPMGHPNMMGQLSNMQPAMGHMGGFQAASGFPNGGGGGMPAPGYFPGGAMPPEMMMAGVNPYQQQYLQALMQQQQQQRMMMMNGQDRPAFPMAGPPPMGYGYGRPMYAPPQHPHPHGEPYSMFSDENPNSCSVM